MTSAARLATPLWGGASFYFSRPGLTANPHVGAERVTNGAAPITFTGDNPSGWTVSGEVGGDPAIKQVAANEDHTGVGTGAVCLYNSATAFQPYMKQDAVLTIGEWFRAEILTTKATLGTMAASDDANRLRKFIATAALHAWTGQATNAKFDIGGNTAGCDITFTSVSVKPITDMDIIFSHSKAYGDFSVVFTEAAGVYQTGVFFNKVDDSNLMRLYYDRTDGKIYLTQRVAGVVTQLGAWTATYVANKTLIARVYPDGSIDILYNGVLIGAAAASGLTGLQAGPFATDSSVVISNYIWDAREMVTTAKIYGVSWDKASAPTLTRTDDAVGMVAAAGVDAGVVVNNFDQAEVYRDLSEVTDLLGNVFVRIPKFYIKKTDGVNSKTWQISKQPFSGAYLPWCFWDFTNSRALDYIDVGKYPASLSGANKLESLPNKYPLINKNIVQMRGYAQANGAGYQQLDLHVVDVLQTLFYVEFATLNSQAIMAGFIAGQYAAGHTATATEAGANRIVVTNATAALYAVGQAISVGTSLGGNQIFYGRTITSIDVVDASNKALVFDGVPVDIAIGNIVYNTGYKNVDGVTAKSGSAVSNSTGKHYCKYRGIVSPWGNVSQFVDGVNVNALQAWVCLNAASYASNLFTSPYAQLGYVDGNADGYITAMGFDANYPFAALTAAAGGSSSTYYSDYYYQAAGQRIAMLGGYWDNGSFSGLSFWYSIGAAAVANVYFGGRLVRKAG